MRLSDIDLNAKESEESPGYETLDGTIVDFYGPREPTILEERGNKYMDLTIRHDVPPEQTTLTYTEEVFEKEVLPTLEVSSAEELVRKPATKVKVAYDIATGEALGIFINLNRNFILEVYKAKG